MRAGDLRVLIWKGLEGIIEHGELPALLRKSHAPGIGHVHVYYSSVPVNEKLKTCVNSIDLSDHLQCSSYASF
jgi:hypothetical protein